MQAQKPRVLLVDDEERILRSLGMLLRMQYEVQTTSDGHEALAMLQQGHVHVLISDQRMPIMAGTELLRRAREISPHTVRLLLTGYADAEATVDSVNEGEVFRYINKPWGPKELRDTVAQAASAALDIQRSTRLPQRATVANATPRLKLLVLDSDRVTVEAVRETVGEQHEVLWSPSLAEAMQVLMTEDIAVLITELQLPGQDVASLLKHLKRERPGLLTVILTCFKDTTKLVELINQAQVYRYLPKPVRKGLLAKSLESTLGRYLSLQATPVLLKTQAVDRPLNELAVTQGQLAELVARLRQRRQVASQPV